MAIFELFSKRQRKLRGEILDVYQYEIIPIELRVQIIHIIKDAFGVNGHGDPDPISFRKLHRILCREYGLFSLREYSNSDFEAVCDFFLNCKELERVIDVIELSFQLIRHYDEDPDDRPLVYNINMSSNGAIQELNERFQENGVGYQFESGEIIRVD